MSNVIWEYWQPEIVIKSIKNNARVQLEKACQMVVDKIKASMLESKSGREYPVGWLKYQASAPGETPAVMFGLLYDNVEYRIEDRGDELVGIIGVNLDDDSIGYAMYLELGTSKMKPRPYLRTKLEENEDEILKILGG